jgi:integrase
VKWFILGQDFDIKGGVFNMSQHIPQEREQDMPDIGKHRYSTNKLFLFTPEQAQRFLEAAKSDQLAALYILAITTGMRRNELLALKWEDIDFPLKRLRVRHTIIRIPGEGFKLVEPKTASSQREIPLMSFALEALNLHHIRQQEAKQRARTLWDDQGLVFCNSIGRPITITTLLTRSFRPVLKKANLPLIAFHDIRKGTAALLFASGVQAQVIADLLGYSLPLSTFLHTHIPFSMREEAITRLETILIRHDPC